MSTWSHLFWFGKVSPPQDLRRFGLEPWNRGQKAKVSATERWISAEDFRNKLSTSNRISFSLSHSSFRKRNFLIRVRISKVQSKKMRIRARNYSQKDWNGLKFYLQMITSKNTSKRVKLKSDRTFRTETTWFQSKIEKFRIRFDKSQTKN